MHGSCDPARVSATFWSRLYPCNRRIIFHPVQGNARDFETEFGIAIGEWHDALLPFDPLSLSYRSATTVSDTGAQVIEVHVPDAAGPWCGRFTSSQIIIEQCTASTAQTDPLTVIRHELGNFYGIAEYRETSDAITAGVSDGCAMSIVNGTIGGEVCRHDLEIIQAGYGYIDSSAVDHPSFLASHIITGATLSHASLELQPGDSVRITVSALAFDHAGGNPSTSPAGTQFLWSIPFGEQEIATVNALGWVEAGEEGHATLSFAIDPLNTRSGTLLSGHARGIIDSLSILVQRALAVDTITGIAPPIISSWPPSHRVTSQIVGVTGAPLLVHWQVTYSHPDYTSFNNDHISVQQYWDVAVPSSPHTSYSIRIVATPLEQKSGQYVAGRAFTLDVPVCIGGGGIELLREDGGGASTEAVQGC